MLDGWMNLAAAVEGNVLATWLRSSAWGYPAVETLHISGLALLFGAAVAFDLRLLGVRDPAARRRCRAVPLAARAYRLRPGRRLGTRPVHDAGADVRRDAALLRQDGHGRHRCDEHDDLPPRRLHVGRSMEPCIPHAASCTNRRRRVPRVLDVGTRLRKVSRLRVTAAHDRTHTPGEVCRMCPLG